MTRDEAQQLMEKRFTEYPSLGAVAKGSEFQNTLSQVLAFHGVDPQLYALVENEVLVILSLYAPLSTLAAHITEVTGLPQEMANKLATLIETLVLEPVIDDLRAYEVLWQKELAVASAIPEANLDTKERLELRPQPSAVPTPGGVVPEKEAAKPLTREELMNALAGKRTMAQDIEAVRMKREAAKGSTPPPPPAPPAQS